MKPRPAILALLSASSACAINNGLARTPQMGWNNWNSLGCDVSESLLLETSAKMVELGLRDVGFKYVVLDDCWSDGRDPQTNLLREDRRRFPNGMKWLAGQIHDQNLLYGMYSSAGEMTCARYEGSLGWEKEDATVWASWDVDYLKYDNCYHRGEFGYPKVSFQRYEAMFKALNATQRPILYSLCSWGEDYVHTWGMSIANSWRISGDIYDSFARPDTLCSCTLQEAASPHCVSPGTHCSVLAILNRVAPYADRSQPGGWNDLDMLEVGMGGMTDDEYVAHFSLWSILKSPLLIGADLRKLSAASLTVLNNPAIIALNQDPLGKSAIRIERLLDVPKDKYGVGETQIWSGQLYGGDQVVLFVNFANEAIKMEASLAEIFVADGPGSSAPQVNRDWNLHDLWADRMDINTAQRIIDAAGDLAVVQTIFQKANWVNSTETSYLDLILNRDERIMGKKVGSVTANGKITVEVPRHACKVYRLRNSIEGEWRYSKAKDEL
jgi:alpha-galactosidase